MADELAKVRSERVVRAFFDEVWNQRRYERLPELFHDECVTHQLRSGMPPATAKRGPAELEHHIRSWVTSFPDVRMETRELLASDDMVAVRAVLAGTHEASWNGIAPTGRTIEFEMMVLYRLADGKVAEDWVLIEAYGAFEQLGLVPDRADLFKSATRPDR